MLRNLLFLGAFAPSVALAGPFSGWNMLGEMGIDNSDPSGLSDTTFFPQITDGGVVDGTVEAQLIPPWVTGDFSDINAELTLTVNTSWAALPFNGLRFTLTDPGAPSLEDFQIVATDIPGFDPARITADGSRIAINFQGMSAAGYITIAFRPPTVTVLGTCPGGIYANFTNFTPNGPIALVGGTGPGSSTIPVGPCAGTALDLRQPRLLTTLTADAFGTRSLQTQLISRYCGLHLVAVDMWSCTTAGMVQLP